jgi:PAS domain S-box-containing protein
MTRHHGPPEANDPSAAARLRQQLRATSRLAELAVRSDSTLVEILQAACHAACEGSGIERSKALMRDPGSGKLKIVAGVGWADDVAGMEVPDGPRSPPGAVMLQGEPVIIQDLPNDHRFDVHEPLKSHGIISVVNVPIREDHTVLGVLELDSDERVELDDDDIGFLESLSGLIVPALIRVRFREDASQAQQRLRESEERLRVALSAARMGTWVLYPSSKRQSLDDNLQQLMGLQPGQQVDTHDDLIEAIHPEDRPAVREAFEQSLREGVELDVEFRVEHPDGTVRWLKDQGRVFPDDSGEPAFMAGACVDITERKEAELRLQRADRVRSEFLAMLAHELRNPMAPLVNSVALLERGSSDPRRHQIALAVMRRQLGHLGRLVDDLLEVSRIEQGKIELRIESIVLGDALRAAVETVQPLADGRHQRLILNLPDERLCIEADAVRVTQVVANLLHNAVKFTGEAGRIDLEVDALECGVSITVRDEGIGIPAEMLPHVFGLFEQGLAQPLDRSRGGLGIGLALVRRLVELHGGSVEAFSDGPGNGSRFIVHLPYAHPPVPQDADGGGG